MISVDLHLHTCYSYDCATPLSDVVRGCRRAGLDCVAITDHNTISGALRLRDEGEFRVIVGEEISTTHGELLGFFLNKPVPRGLSPQETVGRIKEQGGLVCMPHPLGRKPYRSKGNMGSSLDGRFLPSSELLHANRLLTEDVLAALDLIEVINCRTPFASTWASMRRLAEMCGLPQTAGSDAHTQGEIGHARVVMPDFHDAASFLEGVRSAELSGTRSSASVHFASMYAKLRRRRCSD